MSDRVRVLTANLWNGGADPEGLAELVRTTDADVVCTQEMTPEQADALASVLPHGRLEPARDHSGMGIALRRPAALRRVPLPCRDAHVAELVPEDWPGLSAPLEILSVHLTRPYLWGMLQALRERRGQVEGLERHLDAGPRTPRLVVGDFNATPLWPLYRRLTRRLSDAHLHAARRRGARPARTWGPTPSAPRLLRLDHALVDRVQVEDVRILPIPGSDHSALTIDLSP